MDIAGGFATPALKWIVESMFLRFLRAFWIGSGIFMAASQAGALELKLHANQDLVGKTEVIQARYEDTFAALGEQHGLGYTEMLLANPGVDPWLPGEGTRIVLPRQFLLPSGPRRGIVVNLAEYRLYYYTPQGTVLTYPIGIGTDEFPSPLTETRVRGKVPNPTWFPPESIRRKYAAEGEFLPAVVPPGPDNPLGPLKIQLDLPSYLIHGSNKGFGIGTRVSHGCIRMYNEDVLALAQRLPVGAPVRFIEEPVKLGLAGDRLLVELHLLEPPQGEEDLRQLRIKTVQALAAFEREYGPMLIDGDKLKAALERASGLPEVIGQRARMTALRPALSGERAR